MEGNKMGKAIVLGVKFDWADVKNTKSYKEFYDEIGLTDVVKESIDDPEKYGGEVIKQNIYATPYVAARIATIFSKNILDEYVDELRASRNGDEKADLIEIIDTISSREYASGFEAGSVGPEFGSHETSDTMRVMWNNDENFSELDPVIWIFQDGTHEFVKPRKGEAKKFLKLIKSIDTATKKTVEMVKKLEEKE